MEDRVGQLMVAPLFLSSESMIRGTHVPDIVSSP
jgi:hypothetical protein